MISISIFLIFTSYTVAPKIPHSRELTQKKKKKKKPISPDWIHMLCIYTCSFFFFFFFFFFGMIRAMHNIFKIKNKTQHNSQGIHHQSLRI